MSFDKNIVSDYGADNTGVADVSTAFSDWSADAQGLDCVLTVPPGIYKWTTPGNYPFQGMTSLVVSGYGATFQDHDQNLQLGCQTGVPEDADLTARVDTANAGATSVTLLDIADAAIFTVGEWFMITAIDLQGYGVPPNPGFIEYRQIAGITGAVISFSDPLTLSYSKDYRAYDPGSGPPIISTNQGGPATIYAMHHDWGGSNEFQGITFELDLDPFGFDAQQYCKMREAIFTDFTVSGSGTVTATANKLFRIRGSTTFCDQNIEMDKCVEHVIIEDGATLSAIEFQSQCPNLLTITDATVGTLSGTPKKIVASNSAFTTIRLGPIQHLGATQEIIANSCTITNPFTFNDPSALVSTITRSSGVLSNASGLLFGALGAMIQCPGAGTVYGSYIVTGFNVDGSVNTTLPTATDSWIPGVVSLMYHPCPNLKLTSCTGNADAVDFSQAGAYGRPIYSYSKRQYNGLSDSGSDHHVWGLITSLVVNVITPGTGILQVCGQFDTNHVLTAGGTLTIYNPTVDLSVGGVHTLTPTSQPLWNTGTVAPYCASTTAVFTIEWVMDQGVQTRTPRSIEIHGSTFRGA